MTEPEDNRIIDLLYGDLSDDEMSDARASLDTENGEALESLGGVLEVLRSVDDEEPPPHLDALILARAREEAGAASEEALPWWKKLMRGPGLGVAMAGATAVVLGVIVVPNMSRQDEAAQILEVVGEATLEEEMPAVVPGAAEPAKAAPAVPAEAAPAADETDTAKTDKFGSTLKKDSVEGDGRSAVPRLVVPDESAEPEAERARASGKKERADAKSGRRPAREPKPSLAKPQARSAPKSAPTATADPNLDDSVMMRAEKKGTLAGDGASRGSGGGAIGGLASGSAGEDRRQKDEDSEERPADQPATDTLAQNQAAGPSGTVARDSEAEAPAATRSAPPPAPRKKARRKSKTAASSAPTATPKSPSQPDSALPAEVRRAIEQARTLRKKGQVDAARGLLLRTRRRFVRTPSYAVLSQELAELEFEAERYTQASAYARDAMTSKNPSVVRRAKRTFQKSEAAR